MRRRILNACKQCMKQQVQHLPHFSEELLVCVWVYFKGLDVRAEKPSIPCLTKGECIHDNSICITVQGVCLLVDVLCYLLGLNDFGTML